MNPVVRQLIGKELHVNRGFMLMSVLVAVLAALLASFGSLGFALGGILFITAGLGGGIFIAMYSIVQERKDQSQLFACSLPVSLAQFARAKYYGALLSFLLPWCGVTLVGVLAALLLPGLPDGQVVYVIVMQVFILSLCVAFFGATLLLRSEALAGLSIILVNMAFSLFMMGTGRPRFQGPLRSERLVWSSDALLALALELAFMALALVVTHLLLSRRREYI